MDVNTVAVGLIIDPVAFVDVAIYMYELSVAMCAVVFPLALVAGAIRPHLNAVAISETPDPLSLVGRTRLESVQWSLLSLGFRVVLLL